MVSKRMKTDVACHLSKTTSYLVLPSYLVCRKMHIKAINSLRPLQKGFVCDAMILG